MHKENFYLFVPWHMAAMGFLSPFFLFIIEVFVICFNFDDMDRDPSAY